MWFVQFQANFTEFMRVNTRSDSGGCSDRTREHEYRQNW
jgi:hypothetical protein